MHIQRPVLVVSQGGLAPVAVRLAARECDTWIGSRAVAGLVLSSPPEWDAIGEGYDRMEARARCRPSLFEHRQPVAPMQPVTSTHHFHRRWSATSGYSAMFSAHRRRSPVSAGARCAHDHSSGELTPPHIMHASHEPNDGDASNPIESSPYRFFSDRFLFASSADDRFLDACEAEGEYVGEAERLGDCLANEAHHGDAHKWLVVAWRQMEAAAAPSSCVRTVSVAAAGMAGSRQPQPPTHHGRSTFIHLLA